MSGAGSPERLVREGPCDVVAFELEPECRKEIGYMQSQDEQIPGNQTVRVKALNRNEVRSR